MDCVHPNILLLGLPNPSRHQVQQRSYSVQGMYPSEIQLNGWTCVLCPCGWFGKSCWTDVLEDTLLGSLVGTILIIFSSTVS